MKIAVYVDPCKPFMKFCKFSQFIIRVTIVCANSCIQFVCAQSRFILPGLILVLWFGFCHSSCLAAAVLLAGCTVEAFIPTTGMFSRVAKRNSGHNLATLSMKDAALIVQNKVVSPPTFSRQSVLCLNFVNANNS